MQKLFIKNRKDQKICVVIDENNNPKELVFVMHGLSGFKEQPHVQILADAFKERGYTTIMFDTTNTLGESEGKFENATVTNYYEDLEDVIKWAKMQKWYKEPFALTGHSLGAFCTTFYAENYPKEVLALAPISPFISGKLSVEAHERYEPDDFKKWAETGWQISESTSKPGVIKRLPWSHIVDRLKYNLLLKAKNLTMPVLLIVGENDTATPADHVKILSDALPGPKDFYIIKGAPHTFREKEHLDKIKNLFLAWLDKI